MPVKNRKKYRMLLEEFDRLMLEAKSPEELERILKYKLKGLGIDIPEGTFRAVFDADKTKKKSFASWMLQKYGKEGGIIESMVKDGTVSKLFDYFQERSGSGLSLADIPTVKEALSYLPKEKKALPDVLKKNGDAQENDFDVLYQGKDWIVVRPNTFEADRKLGKGCRWCTAAGFDTQTEDDDYFWEKYTNYGPLFINFDLREGEMGNDGREYPFKRYQFCFEFRDDGKHGEFCDLMDKPVTFTEINMPEDAIKFYGTLNEAYERTIRQIKPTKEQYLKERLERSMLLQRRGESELRLMTKLNEDSEYDASESWGVFESRTNYEREVNFEDEEFSPHGDTVVYDGGEDYSIVLLEDIDGHIHTFYYHAATNSWAETFGITKNYGIVEHGDYYFVSESTSVSFWKKHEAERFYISVPDKFNVNFVVNRYQDFAMYFQDAEEIFEIVYDNKIHSLVKFGYEKYVTVLISKDIPQDGQLFTVSEDGYIHGKYSKYKVTEGSNYIESDYDVDKVIPNTNNSCAVVIMKNAEKGAAANIVDCNSGKLLLKDNVYSVDIFAGPVPAGYVMVYKGKYDGFFLYDCIRKKLVYNDELITFEKFFRRIYHGVTIGGSDILFLQNENGECIFTGKKYENIRMEEGLQLVALLDCRGILEILDANSRKILLSMDGIRTYRFAKDFLVVEQRGTDGNGYATQADKIVDIKSGKILVDDALFFTDIIPLGNGFYSYELIDGRFHNIFSLEAGKILPEGYRYISYFNYSHSWVLTESDDKYTFIPTDGTPIYPLREVNKAYVFHDARYDIFGIYIKDGELVPVYTAMANGCDGMIRFHINPADWSFSPEPRGTFTEQERKLVASVMGRRNTSLEEQFRDTFKRIIDFKY